LAVRFWWVFWIRSEVIFSELYSLRAWYGPRSLAWA
jgi:hypothetical protein